MAVFALQWQSRIIVTETYDLQTLKYLLAAPLQSVCQPLYHRVAVTVSVLGMAVLHEADIQKIFSCFL